MTRTVLDACNCSILRLTQQCICRLSSCSLRVSWHSDYNSQGVMCVTGGYVFCLLFGWLLSLLGVQLPGLLTGGIVGMGISLAATALAAANLVRTASVSFHHLTQCVLVQCTWPILNVIKRSQHCKAGLLLNELIFANLKHFHFFFTVLSCIMHAALGF